MDWLYFAGFCCVYVAATISFVEAADDKDYDELRNCLPKLADRCFSKLYISLACHFDPRAPRDCEKETAGNICSIGAEALRCASDIIDGDCKPEEGRDVFDNWLVGLSAVEATFCMDSEMGLKSVLRTFSCWNLADFVHCVNTSVGIGHVVDLMHKKLDLDMCYKLAMGMTSCNAKVTKSTSCHDSFDVVDQSLHALFTATRCGVSCPTQDAGNGKPRQKYPKNESQKKKSVKDTVSSVIKAVPPCAYVTVILSLVSVSFVQICS